jgi:membrane-associated protein
VTGLVERLLDAVADLGGPALHAVAFLLAFGECALFLDLVVPGEAGMVVVGAAAARGDYPLPTLIAAAGAGAIAGDSFSYFVGRRWGLALVRRWEPVRKRLEPRIEHAHGYFERRGGAAVFLGRFVGVLRGVVPVVAGTSSMPYPRFLMWNALASIVWTSAVLTAGYVVGRNVETIVSRVGLAVTAAVIAGVVVWWLVRRRRHGAGDRSRRSTGARR